MRWWVCEGQWDHLSMTKSGALQGMVHPGRMLQSRAESHVRLCNLHHNVFSPGELTLSRGADPAATAFEAVRFLKSPFLAEVGGFQHSGLVIV
ncbi:hypothetical protein AAFF_G00305970 [Aldrovandia affinis]|uniref:Uncharacterized protein n=1 Tax=Aldrovandia affinis TaxID=143900 RepID=A0AAD7SPM9_9TELE|nr:hypothetical protein AAFF_G00305970 [Aldrovandia affinis]